VKTSYEEKIKELRGRLKNREEGKEVGKYCLTKPRIIQAEEEEKVTIKIKSRVISRDRSAKQSSLKNQTSNGKMSQD
jgi:hypothetical protein